MSIKIRITEKETIIKSQLEELRKQLNEKRSNYNKNPNDWSYLTALSFTENKLNEIFQFIDSAKVV